MYDGLETPSFQGSNSCSPVENRVCPAEPTPVERFTGVFLCSKIKAGVYDGFKTFLFTNRRIFAVPAKGNLKEYLNERVKKYYEWRQR